MGPLLTIGEFADQCGLSRSALRFYDRNALLRPHEVDRETGYRYYAVEQLARAALVRRLRAAEMPVEMVHRYLTASFSERQRLLQVHLTASRERVAVIEDAVRALQLEIQGNGIDQPTCWIAATEFAHALQQVRFAIAQPGARAGLEAVWIETKDNSLRVVATDSYRIAIRDVLPHRIDAGNIRGAIHADHLPSLITHLAAAQTLVVSQGQTGEVIATIDSQAITVGHRGQEFPDYEEILAGLPTGYQIALPRQRVEDALSVLPTDTKHLELTFEPKRIVLRAGSEIAVVTGQWAGPVLNFDISYRFFAESVDAMVGPDLVIEALDSWRPLTLRSADTGTLTVLTMPSRANK